MLDPIHEENMTVQTDLAKPPAPKGQLTIHRDYLAALLADAEAVGECARRLLDAALPHSESEDALLLRDLYEGVGRMAETVVATEALGVPGSNLIIDLRSSESEDGDAAVEHRGLRRRRRSPWVSPRFSATG